MTSLYPTINKRETYPIGHPEIIADVKKYRGVVKCVVKAPGSVLFPVLPPTFNGKLVFSLCSMCTREKMQQYCEHEGAERHLEATWCTPELHDALDNGYEI